MEQDKEMLDIFTDEIMEIQRELSKKVHILLEVSEKDMNKELFSEFG